MLNKLTRLDGFMSSMQVNVAPDYQKTFRNSLKTIDERTKDSASIAKQGRVLITKKDFRALNSLLLRQVQLNGGQKNEVAQEICQELEICLLEKMRTIEKYATSSESLTLAESAGINESLNFISCAMAEVEDYITIGDRVKEIIA